ncbi:hypothetical protein [Flagellimonas amoyensis]|uniref:hypothetical protein n=1 Tax=Flagellimonas amoyensis TaxID=2169401 RepID=UPI000D3ACFAD|nr:hypothetical protein [Allomuricauda amoyensis]
MKPRTSKSYQEEVLKKYRREKGGEMSGYLANPTRRQIREACIWLLDKRKMRYDEHTLIRFFQFQEGKSKIVQMQQFKPDRFLPIVNFLKGKTNDTGPENLELIAWLIDFQPRPYEEFLKSYGSTHAFETDEQEPEYITLRVASEVPISPPEKKEEEELKKRRRLIITISIVFTTLLFIILVIKPSLFNSNPIPNTENHCMAWADSLYVEVSCTSNPYSDFGTKVEPMDRVKLNSFKKVEVSMATDFFSEDEKPLIWYFKTKDGEMEFFTAPGLHPITGETLRKITPYIIETYVPLHINNTDSFLPRNQE